MAHNKHGLLNVQQDPPLIADPNALKNGFIHKTDKGTLFPQPPVRGDVEQGHVGDCYYLSAILSILGKPDGAEFIESMMLDHGDQTVTVRFMKKGDGGDLQPAYGPEYVRVRKTFVHATDKSTPPRSVGKLWVMVLEKAYAAWILGNRLPSDYFEKIAAGQIALLTDPEGTLSSLLGNTSQGIGLSSQETLKLPWAGMDAMGLYADNPSAKLVSRIAALRDYVFQNDHDLTNEWIRFLKANVDEFYKQRLEWRRDDFNHIALSGNMSSRLKLHLDNYFDREMLLPGKRGTGIYTQEQIDKFGAINVGLAQGRVLELTARVRVGTKTEAGNNPGETKSKGMVGFHAYAVLKTKRDSTPPYRRWILVRNPWGEYGRKYVAHPGKKDVLKSAVQDDAEFWLELSDLTKCFVRLSDGGVLRPL
jgi:hypothetical protein